MIDIKNAKTSELVSFYNRHSGRNIKKFQDRATAEARVAALIAELREEAKPAPTAKAPAAASTPAGQPRSSASEAIARSWLNSEVAAKRKQRSAVLVDGVEYSSVRAAYIALDLPLKDHIAFRMYLKEVGKPVEVEGREWVIIPKNY